jgi:hypothetical protein
MREGGRSKLGDCQGVPDVLRRFHIKEKRQKPIFKLRNERTQALPDLYVARVNCYRSSGNNDNSNQSCDMWQSLYMLAVPTVRRA